ncbi:MAG TPA: peptidylprolyl isomerase [Gemmatimonadetes bacterium]|nr:peptidylprolyl isomerase [Gemmatimonadota bacterium]
MKITNTITILLLAMLVGVSSPSSAQTPDGTTGRNLDQIVGFVGDEVILKSEIELQYQSQASVAFQGYTEEQAKCLIMEDNLFQKLLINEARVDSVEVSDEQVDGELDRRMRYFVDQIGSEQQLEDYYGKSILEIKSEFREMIEHQLLVQKMRARNTENIKVTPADVKAYFSGIPEDSLPYINSEIEFAHIVKKPPIGEEERERIKSKLEDLRRRIVNGEDFGMLAYMYSEDPGSAKQNGELGPVERGALVPEFEGVAFNLKGEEVSEIIETEYGYHIMQLIERIGERVNVRHILLTPQVSSVDLKNAREILDSIQQAMLTDTLTFAEAAEKFSDEEETRMIGGKMINPQTGSTKFEPSQVDPMLLFSIDKMKVGQTSEPVLMRTSDGKEAYHLIKLIRRTDPHRASLEQDYQKLQAAALEEKQSHAITKWIAKKQADTYIKIGEEYSGCTFTSSWKGLQ